MYCRVASTASANLSVANDVVATALPGDEVTFTWDAAAYAAAGRSSRPLFIGWSNDISAPVYSAVSPLGAGRGSTTVPSQLSGFALAVLTTQPELEFMQVFTQATLAGPVVVSLLQ